MIVDGYEMTESHSEKHIYEGCLSLLHQMVGHFEDYLDWLGIEPPDESGEHFCVYLNPQAIVERLFLWNTAHSGGTSQIMKCRELGIDPWKSVKFEDERGKDNDD